MADKATRIDLFSLRTVPMRAFHLTWMAFFVCFFAWFACAPLMPLIKKEFGLSVDQVANIIDVWYCVITKLAPTAPMPRRHSRKLV